MEKLEYSSHIQKRVGCRFKKVKKRKKGFGGKRKLTYKFIDKLQKYYGIAIRRNIENLKNMQYAVIAEFFYCCSSNNKPMHGQSPSGPDSSCKDQQTLLARN